MNYIEQNYGIIDGLNIGKIDFKTNNTAGISAKTEGKNSGIIKNIILNIGNNLTFHNYKTFKNDDKQSSINVASSSKFYNEEGATVSNYEINNDYGLVYNFGTIDKNSTINNSYTFYNGTEDNKIGSIIDSVINNGEGSFYNYGTIEGATTINNDENFYNYGTIDVDKVNTSRPSTWQSFKNYGTLKANELNNESYDDNDFEKYKFEWKGKSECYRIAGKRSTGTLRPEDIEAMCELVPAKIVSSEQAFKDDTALSNAHYILKDKGIEMKLL